MNSAPERSQSAFARWGVVLLLMGYTALGHLNREGLAIVGNEVFIKKLGITEVQMGSVYSAFLVIYTIGMLPGGWLIDRIGSGRALTLFGLSLGTFVVLTGALDWLTSFPWQLWTLADGSRLVLSAPLSLWVGLLVIRGLSGACNSPLHPGAAHVASDLMPDRHRATVNGLRTAGALLGIAFSYHIFGWLIDHLNWPWVFVVSGGALIVCGLVWKLFASPLLPVPQPHRRAENDSLSSDELVGENNISGELTPAARHERWLLLCSGNLWLLTLSYAAYGYFQYLFFYWMDYYFKNVLHVPDSESRQASFYIFLAMGAGMAIGGFCTGITSNLFGTIRGRRSIVMTGMGLGALFALLAVNRTDPWSVSACLAFSMGSLGMCEGVFWTTATDIGGKSRGFSGAFMNTGGNVGGFISPVLTPLMAATMGWPGAITVACLIAGLGGLLWFVIKLPETSRMT